MLLRDATEMDLQAIAEIYNQAVLAKFETAETDPVTLDNRRAWLAAHTPDRYPVYVCEIEGKVAGWVSLSPYRPGREALRYAAEISYYVHSDFRRRGIATALIEYASGRAMELGLKTLFAIVLDKNAASVAILIKMGFEKWGHLPRIADFDGEECGHLYYGKRIRE